MTPAAHIIAKFGGTRPAAAALGKPPSTVQSWKDAGFIPAKWQADVLAKAKENGVELRPEDFFATGGAA